MRWVIRLPSGGGEPRRRVDLETFGEGSLSSKLDGLWLVPGPMLLGPQEKPVWQFFWTHIDQESQTFSSSVSVEGDARFRGVPWKPRNPIKQALWSQLTDVMRRLRAYFCSNLGGTLSSSGSGTRSSRCRARLCGVGIAWCIDCCCGTSGRAYSCERFRRCSIEARNPEAGIWTSRSPTAL
jgi:hypothetical protein